MVKFRSHSIHVNFNSNLMVLGNIFLGKILSGSLIPNKNELGFFVGPPRKMFAISVAAPITFSFAYEIGSLIYL